MHKYVPTDEMCRYCYTNKQYMKAVKKVKHVN